MSRAKRGATARACHKKVISVAKSFRGCRNNVYRIAKQAVMRAGQYVYRGRRNKKRVFCALRTARTNAGARKHGSTYSKFMNGLKRASTELDHEVLSDMAIHDKVAFATIVNQVKANVA